MKGIVFSDVETNQSESNKGHTMVDYVVSVSQETRAILISWMYRSGQAPCVCCP